MHNICEIDLKSVTKIEGDAALHLEIEDDKVKDIKFQVTESKRFFTQAMRGKPVIGLPQLLARICGTCSNAHIMASIEACEKALGVKVTEQTKLLRSLTMYALMIRDHALHLYLFVMPDFFGKDSFLELDENDEAQHQLLHDAFEIKAAGNFLAQIIAGRSIHATSPTIGGFLHFPSEQDLQEAIVKLEKIRPAVLRLIDVMKNSSFSLESDTNFVVLDTPRFNFLEGDIISTTGERITEAQYREHLERVVIPYSQALGFKYDGQPYMVGALARLNLIKDKLHKNTKKDVASALELFPSKNVFHNNLAQAIEILHSVDDALEILKNTKISPEPIVKFEMPKTDTVGVGVIEAPRGILYHRVHVGTDGKVIDGELVIPTGQNQIILEKNIGKLAEKCLAEKMDKDKITFEIEKLIRAYDPCMSCATHFLKVKWTEK